MAPRRRIGHRTRKLSQTPLPSLKVGDPTPERKAKAPRVREIPTEIAGIKATFICSAFEKLAKLGYLTDEQAAAGEHFQAVVEKFTSTGYPESTLARLEMAIGSTGTRTDYSPPDWKLEVARRYRRMREVLGDQLGLVEGVALWDLVPTKPAVLNTLRVALDRIANV